MWKRAEEVIIPNSLVTVIQWPHFTTVFENMKKNIVINIYIANFHICIFITKLNSHYTNPQYKMKKTNEQKLGRRYTNAV